MRRVSGTPPYPLGKLRRTLRAAPVGGCLKGGYRSYQPQKLPSQWPLTSRRSGVILLPFDPGETVMTKPDPKENALRALGALYPRPQAVADELFQQGDFFDARDLVQVKYEMLRRVRVDGRTVTDAASDFGFSRPTYYQAERTFESEGLPGLIPRKRGPKAAHKLTDEVLDFVESALEQDPSLNAPALTERITKRFSLVVHPRSVERALARRREGRRRKRGLQ